MENRILKYKGMLSEKRKELEGGGKPKEYAKNRKFLFIDSSN